MIACDRALVYRGHTKRLTWASLGCYLIRRRCSRQRKLANPLIRKGQTLKKYLPIRQLSFGLFAVFVTVFFRFYTDYIFLSAAKILLVQLSVIFVHILLCPYWIRPWHLLRGEKQTNKQTNKLVCRLAFPHPFLPASKLHRQNNSKLAQVNLLAHWFIVHLGIVVT